GSTNSGEAVIGTDEDVGGIANFFLFQRTQHHCQVIIDGFDGGDRFGRAGRKVVLGQIWFAQPEKGEIGDGVAPKKFSQGTSGEVISLHRVCARIIGNRSEPFYHFVSCRRAERRGRENREWSPSYSDTGPVVVAVEKY